MAATKIVVQVRLGDLVPFATKVVGGILYFARDSVIAKLVSPIHDVKTLNELAAAFPKLVQFVSAPAFVGRVLRTEGRTERISSDEWDTFYYPIVWDDVAGKERALPWNGVTKQHYDYETKTYVREWAEGLAHPFNDVESAGRDYDRIYVGTQEGWENETRTYETTQWVVDATPETIAAWGEWVLEGARKAGIKYAAESVAKFIDTQYNDAYRLRSGRDAVVVKGRKIKVGTVVRVEFTGDGQYGAYANVRTADGKQTKYVSIENLQVVVDDWDREFTAFHAWLTEDKRATEWAKILGAVRAWAAGALDWGIVCDAFGDDDAFGIEVATVLQGLEPETKFNKDRAKV